MICSSCLQMVLPRPKTVIKNFFDDQRLNELLNKPNYQSPKDVIDEVVKAVKEFESGVEQSDDTANFVYK